MIEKVLEELVAAKSTNDIVSAGEQLKKRIKNSRDIRRLFVESGEFLIKFEANADQLFDDMALVLSEENMKRLAKDVDGDSGYKIKSRLLQELMNQMNKYDIPHEYAKLYANRLLGLILEQLPEVAPEKYDRFFQADWREEQNKQFCEIAKAIERIDTEIEKYQKQSLQILSADQIDLQLKRETFNPRIGIDFFSVDDEAFQVAFAKKSKDTVIRVRAKCMEEAVYCIINELWKSEEKRGVYVVKRKEDWEKLRALSSVGNVYIPWYYDKCIVPIENNTNVFIYTDEIPSFTRDEIVLRPRTYHTIIDALVSAGMAQNDAFTLVRETHGRYIPLKKKLFSGLWREKPEWMDRLPNRVKLTALLIGQWKECEGDKLVIGELFGEEYDKFYEQIEPSFSGEEPFVLKINNHGENEFYLTCVENTWEYLDIDCNSSIWKAFRQLFIEVLTEHEPMLTYQPQEYVMAQIKGERVFCSPLIRNGMLRSMIMKAYYKNDSILQQQIDQIVDDILSEISGEDKWRYLSAFFADLCELSPRIILNRLFSEFDNPTGLLDLFEHQTDDFIMGKNHYIDVIFGVEKLLVQEEFASKGFEWLLKLDDKPFSYKSNSPKDSIEKVLCAWANFSAFQTPDEKAGAARMALKCDRNAWDYIFDALPLSHRSIIGDISKPRYREHVGTESVTMKALMDTVKLYIELLIERTDFIPERWGKLLGIIDKFTEASLKKALFEVSSQVTQMSDEERVVLKDSIRKTIYDNRYYSSASWAMKEDTLNLLEKLMNEIQFSVEEYEYEYLFNHDGKRMILHPTPYEERGIGEHDDSQFFGILKEKIREFSEKGLDLSALAKACSNDKGTNLGSLYARYAGDGFSQEVFRVFYSATDDKRIALDYSGALIGRDENAWSSILKLKNDMKFSDPFTVALYVIEARNAKTIPAIADAEEHIKTLFWEDMNMFLTVEYEWALEECRKYGNISNYCKLLFRANKELCFSIEKLFTYVLRLEEIRVGSEGGDLEYYLVEILKPVQNAYKGIPEKAQQIAKIELLFLYVLNWSQMICLQAEIKRTPEIYAELAANIFIKDDDVEQKNSDDNKRKTQAITKLLLMAEFCPAEKEGKVDSDDLKCWIQSFQELLRKNKQIKLFGYLIGRLLPFSPPGEDGFYPCEAIREVVEKFHSEDMLSEYALGMRNKRGVYSPSAGKEEIEIAERYKENAEALKCDYPNTADVFFRLYHWYLSDAERERERAVNEY